MSDHPTYELESGRCPHCQADFKGKIALRATATGGTLPEPGDFCVCPCCGCILRFETTGLFVASQQDMEEIPIGALIQMKMAQRRIVQLRAALN